MWAKTKKLLLYLITLGTALGIEDVQQTVNADALDELLESDEVKALTARISAGYSSNWNGSNHIGSLNDDAQAALEELQQLIYTCDRLDHGQGYWDAGMWLEGAGPSGYGITATTTDAELEAKVAQIIAEAEAVNVLVEERPVLGVLKGWRERLRDEVNDG